MKPTSFPSLDRRIRVSQIASATSYRTHKFVDPYRPARRWLRLLLTGAAVGLVIYIVYAWMVMS